MQFSAQLKSFGNKTRSNLGAIQDRVTDTVYTELVNGGTISGAPGQPDDLRAKFERSDEGLSSTILTKDHSALAVESGISQYDGSPIKLKSNVGGFHSLALILAARQAIVDGAARKVGGNG